MGQFSAELNYERRLERYEEEWEERILKSENWEEELERYLEEAMKRWEEIEEQEEGLKVEAKEYEGSFLLMMAGNLSNDEKWMKEEYEKGEREEKERKVVTSGGLALLHKPREDEEAVETGDHLRELIEAIETLAEEGPFKRMRSWGTSRRRRGRRNWPGRSCSRPRRGRSWQRPSSRGPSRGY
ncbi:MAG: hypothetical protein QW231_03730 [Candidatus Bathyarchaeia archaeon]